MINNEQRNAIKIGDVVTVLYDEGDPETGQPEIQFDFRVTGLMPERLEAQCKDIEGWDEEIDFSAILKIIPTPDIPDHNFSWAVRRLKQGYFVSRLGGNPIVFPILQDGPAPDSPVVIWPNLADAVFTCCDFDANDYGLAYNEDGSPRMAEWAVKK